jgi:CheY-like chemotaxis protein
VAFLGRRGTVIEDKARGETPFEGRKILVVDDEPDELAHLAAILEDCGATIVRAAGGDQAIELARREKPDLMTLDLSMPGTSGVDVFVAVREDPELSELPICIITGRPEMRKLIYERPAHSPPEGYLDKPVNRKVLVRNIRKIFELRGHKRT